MAGLHLGARAFAKSYRRISHDVRSLSSNASPNLGPGYVHDLRVGGRRLQTLLRLLPRSIRQSPDIRAYDTALRMMMKTTSPVRDLDTLMVTLRALHPRVGSRVIMPIRKNREKLAAEALGTIQAFSQMQVPDIDSKLINEGKLSRRLEKRLRKLGRFTTASLAQVLVDESEVEGLHSLRLEVKGLRYLHELVEPEPLELPIFRRWQDSLGAIHDYDVALAYLARRLQSSTRDLWLESLAESRHLEFRAFARMVEGDEKPLKGSRYLAQSTPSPRT